MINLLSLFFPKKQDKNARYVSTKLTPAYEKRRRREIARALAMFGKGSA